MTSENPQIKRPITHQFLQVVRISDETRFDRYFVPTLLAIGVIYSGLQFLNGDFLLSFVSGISVAMLTALAALDPVQDLFLRRLFDRSHATYIALFWCYSLLWVRVYRQLATTTPDGKESTLFYILLILFLAITFRALLTLFALTPIGNDSFISRLPIWEKVLVAGNEMIAAGLLAVVAGSQLAQLLQPGIFTLYVNPVYPALLLVMVIVYYLMLQLMWLRRWNRWLSNNHIWVRLARLLAPLALITATMVIIRHFTRLSDTRTADLLGTADLDQNVLALSPVLWMLIFFVLLLVYTSRRGLRQRFLPDNLTALLSERARNWLSTISDMDILLMCGVFIAFIPLHLVLFENDTVGILDTLRQQLSQNALIDTSDQALAVVFAFPFYVLTILVLGIYASVLANPKVDAHTRDDLVKKLPISQLIILIITLYLCAIPFSQVLSEGRLPQLPQELGRVLAFDVLIPLILLYVHYFIFIRIPYGRGQSLWRTERSSQLERDLKRADQIIDEVQNKLKRAESIWLRRRTLPTNQDEKINMLYEFIELNSERDHWNMERLKIINERQELAEISEAPISLTIARLPTRVISFGIPLLLAFKIYEWAIVNDGLREIANNPNIGIIEFFQIILEQTQF
jgi:hypothetical protein